MIIQLILKIIIKLSNKIDIKDIQINNLQIKVYYIKNNKIIKIEQIISL